MNASSASRYADGKSFPGLGAENLGWLHAFRQRRGRSPAVLHIGNVANNAYIFAKALNATGIESDVLCYDDYHIMACPEWEDAGFDGPIDHACYPNWDGVDLHGFSRPRWFAQGPFEVCVDYLLARRVGKNERQRQRWGRLERRRRIACAAGRGSRLAMCRQQAFRGMRVLGRWLREAGQTLSLQRSGLALEDLISKYRSVFPDRQDQLVPGDFPLSFAKLLAAYHLFDHYDLVVGYATDGIYPLMLGKPYFAFEHGTIRNLPFEASAAGRLCALTYRQANHVFITNQDNIAAAQKLGIADFSFLPHPLNEHQVSEAESAELRSHLEQKLQANFLVFHPARQHWSSARNPNWEKGNDVLIEGFAKFVHEVCPRAGAVFVNWGQTVSQSRDLIAQRGIADRVEWIEPQGNRRLLAYISAADVLADQFVIPAMGGMAPKGLRLGRPTMTNLDENLLRWCLPEIPPVINVNTADAVFDALVRLYRNPDHARALQISGPAWYAAHHSLTSIVERFITQMRKVIT